MSNRVILTDKTTLTSNYFRFLHINSQKLNILGQGNLGHNMTNEQVNFLKKDKVNIWLSDVLFVMLEVIHT